MNHRGWTFLNLGIAMWLLVLAVIGTLLFMLPRPTPGRLRDEVQRLREGAVGIIADGVEKGVRRVTEKKE